MMRGVLLAIGAIAIVAGSFVLTSIALNRWSTPSDPTAGIIHVVEATYGLDCQGFQGPSGPVVVKAGNATAYAASLCDQSRDRCDFPVDVSKIGDTAPGCGKDFSVSWRCGNADTIHKRILTAEANGKSALLVCPADF